MDIDAFLVGPIVIGRHVQRGVGARILGVLGQLDGVGRIVGATAGDYRNPAPRHLDGQLDQAAVLLGRQGRGLAGGAAGHQSVASFVDLPLDEITEYRMIDSSRRKWRHQRGYRPEKHELFPSPGLVRGVRLAKIEGLVHRLIRTGTAGCPA